MGEFEVLALPEVSAKLQSQWNLEPGAVFNRAYVETFVGKNHSLLPSDFTADRVQLIEDCRDTSVSVHLHLRYDPQHEALDHAKSVDCSPPCGQQREKMIVGAQRPDPLRSSPIEWVHFRELRSDVVLMADDCDSKRAVLCSTPPAVYEHPLPLPPRDKTHLFGGQEAVSAASSGVPRTPHLSRFAQSVYRPHGVIPSENYKFGIRPL